MFEAVELGRKISKEDYERELLDFRTHLLRAQFAIQKTNSPVLIVIGGVEGAGKGEAVNELSQWFDVRGVEVQHFQRPSDEAEERPEYWRYWMSLPPRGRIALYYGSWYTRPIVQRVERRIKKAEFESQLQRIADFERMLAEDRALVLKFWLHITKDEQRRRFRVLDGKKATRWRVTPRDWQYHDLYDRFAQVSESAIRQTDSGRAPWHLIEATDARYRNLAIGRIILDTFQHRLAQEEKAPAPRPVDSGPSAPAPGSVLDKVDLNRVATETHAERLEKAQERLARLTWKAERARRSTVVVFEGWDAAGKGGAIRRLSQAIDARIRRVISVAAPTDEERARHYLWRFWRHLPRGGNVTIYDRSWYGRVLVERVEGFAREEEWKRAYLEINEFEEQLVESGVLVLKFFIHISKDEQAKRFKEREQITYKQHKITEEDWRNRGKWDDYELAINEMVSRTSTSHAPWTLVSGNDKRVGRLEVLETMVARLEKAL